MNRILLILCAGLFTTLASAQTTFGLVAHYSFDNDTDTVVVDETGNLSNNGFSNISVYDCGVRGNAIRFNGMGDEVILDGSAVKEAFGTEDFTLSFYFKPLNSNQVTNMTILSKRNDCSNNNALAVRYTPNDRFLNVLVSENNLLSASFITPLSQERCWYHVTIVRDGTNLLLYIDGVLVDTDAHPERIDLTSDNLPLLLGTSSCNATDGSYEGFLDEVRIYNRSLSKQEVKELFFRPDEIGNGFVDLGVEKDTILFLGNFMETYITNTCADQFSWSPLDGVQDETNPNTILSPTETTTYYLAFTDLFGCTAVDSLLITVVDPADLECEAFLPNTFTPNGDGLNETFGIDNPFALPNFIALSIYDRIGNEVFWTDNPTERWDGSYRSTKVNPGVYIYRVQYMCNGEEKVEAGSITIMR
ncbi:MAG: LamG-like jellyroll fold domain-containing protein [Bacteroidota bacterium]